MIAIVGPPNAGKSSLLNALARRDAAIVSTVPGTTRDVVEVRLDLGGYPVILADTAGLRAPGDSDAAPGDPHAALERIGIERARARLAESDLAIAVFDARGWAGAEGPPPDERALAAEAGLIVLNKRDLLDEAGRARATEALGAAGIAPDRRFLMSVLHGTGLDGLLAALEGRVADELAPALAAPGLTRARHRVALRETLAALDRAALSGESELLAEDLRLALRSLGRITGRVDVEEVLDALFREFCIGK